ncbi:hypothetical protein BC832DRAFT_381085 [Gaertneriomyces semiglobifer]|nr:hypothetical protein BC832DRAFT_381085 [Gaertneriomyces semiglobifer]
MRYPYPQQQHQHQHQQGPKQDTQSPALPTPPTSQHNLFRSSNSLHSQPSASHLFEARQRLSQDYFQQQQQQRRGSSYGSAPNLHDPEAGLDHDVEQQQQHYTDKRRGSVLQVFGSELKKSWTSLGNITMQAAHAVMNSNPLTRTSSHGDNILPTHNSNSSQNMAYKEHETQDNGLYGYFNPNNGMPGGPSEQQVVVPQQRKKQGQGILPT